MLGACGAGAYLALRTDPRDATIRQLQQRQDMLQRVVKNLSAERRVAEMLVLSRTTGADGVVRSEVLFVEHDRNGQPLPPRTFTLIGETAHVDAMVIRFQRGFVEEGDALRGQSVALFTRIYGDKQAPADGNKIDEPGQIPALYRTADPKVAQFERELWRDFWKLADDKQYAASKGVHVAFGQSVWGPFAEDKLYVVTLQSDAGLTLDSEPLRPIYREALRRAASSHGEAPSADTGGR